MTPFLYRCPTTGLMVQSLHENGEADEDNGGESFVSVDCLACSGTHLVSPTSGKVMGSEDE